MLKLDRKDVFYDLGCGDAQLLIEASPKVKKAVGIEIDPVRFLIAKLRASKRKNIEIIYGNLFNIPMRDATKISVFLLEGTNKRLGKKLNRECRNALVASYKWPVPGLKPKNCDKANRVYIQTNR